jgi:DNA helicase-2/ATP-dependent DNA helicase PcrA
VTAERGAALVIAGAGAGKTRTLTYRVAWLLEQGVPEDRILLLTFTNKAAKEMMTRVADLLGSEVSRLWGGTFHSVGNRILRRHAEKVGWKGDFSILDREDSKELLSACIDEAQIDVKATRFPKAEVLRDVFSMATNKCRSIAETLAEDYPHFQNLTVSIEPLYEAYEKRKQATNSMDFDDLLVQWLRLLETDEEAREQYQRRFEYVLVDEYQDTNHLQGALIDLLAARHGNVMVVGDDAQSIYSWRGANFRNILDFPRRYPGAKTYKIETNYRSVPEILQVANAVIAGNTEQFHKELATSRGGGMKPAVVSCADGGEQAAFVAQRALELRDEGIALEDMAILYRSHFHAMEMQLELTRRNIPFAITSGIRFFEQAHIKDVASWLKLVCNPRDELAFKRLARMLPGVGGKTADKLWRQFAGELGEPAGELVPTDVGIAAALQKIEAGVPRKAKSAWAQFSITVSQLEAPEVNGHAADMIRIVLEAGYEEHLQATYENWHSRLEDVEQLAEFSRQFDTLGEFLTELALLTNVEAEAEAAADNDDERIRLSSIHQAKGLEFRVVFVIMLCDGLFPSHRSLDSLAGEEEERRLFYVAVTRAKDELYLCHPLMRYVAGAGGETLQQPSRFLAEIPLDLVEEWRLHASDMPF